MAVCVSSEGVADNQRCGSEAHGPWFLQHRGTSTPREQSAAVRMCRGAFLFARGPRLCSIAVPRPGRLTVIPAAASRHIQPGVQGGLFVYEGLVSAASRDLVTDMAAHALVMSLFAGFPGVPPPGRSRVAVTRSVRGRRNLQGCEMPRQLASEGWRKI